MIYDQLINIFSSNVLDINNGFRIIMTINRYWFGIFFVAHIIHTRTHARTRARTHARTHERTHARSQARTRTNNVQFLYDWCFVSVMLYVVSRPSSFSSTYAIVK